MQPMQRYRVFQNRGMIKGMNSQPELEYVHAIRRIADFARAFLHLAEWIPWIAWTAWTKKIVPVFNATNAANPAHAANRNHKPAPKNSNLSLAAFPQSCFYRRMKFTPHLQMACIILLQAACIKFRPRAVMNRTRRTALSFVCLALSLVTIPAIAATQQTPACPTGAASPTPSPPQTTSAASQKGFLDQNQMTGDWGGLRKTFKDDGLTLTPIYYGEVFGNPTGGAAQGLIYDGLLDLNLDLDLDKMSDGALADLTFHVDADYIHGASLSAGFIGDFSNTSNIAGYNSLRLQGLWMQKLFWDKRLALKVGNISVDAADEFFVSTSGSLFLSGTFGAFTLISTNVPNPPVYPAASPGVQIRLQPNSNFYVMAGVFGMDANSNLATNNQNGTRFALTASSGMLVMSEAGFLLNQSPNDHGLQGTYKIGSWLDTGSNPTWASRAEEADGTGSLRDGGANYGVYGVMDQQIYSQGDQTISLFVRSGGAPSNTNFVDWYAEGGFNFTGFIPGRSCDVAGLAVARSHVSKDFSDSEIAEGENPFTAETVVEATYKVQLAQWWSIQPDFQYIFTPGGEEGVVHDAVVLGLRTTVAF
jgi:porin